MAAEQTTLQSNPAKLTKKDYIRDAKPNFSALPYEGTVYELFKKAYDIKLRAGGWDDSPVDCKLGGRWSSYGCNLLESLDTNRFNVHTDATYSEILLSMQKIARNIYGNPGEHGERTYTVSLEFVDGDTLFKILKKKGDFCMPYSGRLPWIKNDSQRRKAFSNLVDALVEGEDKVWNFHATYHIGNSRERYYIEGYRTEGIPEKVAKEKKSFLKKIGNSYFGGFSVVKEGSGIFKMLSKLENLIQEEFKDPLAVFPEKISVEYERKGILQDGEEPSVFSSFFSNLDNSPTELSTVQKRRFNASLWWGDTPKLLLIAIKRRENNLSNQKLGVEWRYEWPSKQPDIMRNDADEVDDILRCMGYVGVSSHPGNHGGHNLPKEKFEEYTKLWELRKKFDFR